MSNRDKWQSFRNEGYQRSDVIYRPLQGVSTLAEIRVVWQRANRSPILHAFLDVVKAQTHAEAP